MTRYLRLIPLPEGHPTSHLRDVLIASLGELAAATSSETSCGMVKPCSGYSITRCSAPAISR
ncbi:MULTISPECIES: hypothetical protein [unclassified Streptomyces]|uniref:hypothetical protein n=1 Tax=unclassified Streptomyces TaxID=2593676 RepID=UPI003D8F1A40